MSQKKLFLLDAMALIYRAYFALNKNPRINSKGLNTSATLGFTNTLFEVIRKENPTHIAVVFDTATPTARHENFAAYKAHREDMPDDLSSSLPYIRRVIEGFNIPIIQSEGYEADDVIGTLAKKAEKEDFITYMMTTDKDFGQLVSDKIFIYKPSRQGDDLEILGVKEVCAKYEIERPEQLIDILGLWGDVSDNIPGIPGVGEVTAKKLIKEYGSVENVLQNADKIKGKLGENVKQFQEQAIISKSLATILLDAPVELDEEKLKISKPDIQILTNLFDELEFRMIAKRVSEWYDKPTSGETKTDLTSESNLFSNSEKVETEQPQPKNNIQNISHQYYLVDTSEKIDQLIEKLKTQKSFCFDTETTGLDVHNCELVGISFSYIPHEAYFVIMPENYHDTCEILNKFKFLFEDETIEKIGQNIKFDMAVLKWYEIEVKGKFFDTMLAHYLIQPDMRHNMDMLAEVYLNYTPVPIESLIGKKGKNQLSMRTVAIQELYEYACEDADITLQLKNVFEPMLEQTTTRELFDNIEMPLIPVLASIEMEGVKIDKNYLDEYSIQLSNQISQLEKEIIEIAGKPFNIASPKQLGEIIYEHLNIIEKPKYTKTKQYSTGEDVLIKFANKHPIISKILNFRLLSKLKSTYVDSLPLLINQRTGRVHASFNQAVAATGRLSSNNPNLQNIPIRSDEGREIRKAFIPRNENYTFLSADYSQIELRIMAELSKDENMLAAFGQGLDIHTATAARVYNVRIEDVTKEQRRNAKTVNFGIIYGISSFGLSERLNIPRKNASEMIEQYFNMYPSIKEYMDKTIDFARRMGYVETIMGRRRYVRDINASNGIVRGYAERNAINAPIQGSAADMIKIAMINIYKEISEKNLQSKLIMQVHDELNFDAYKNEVEDLKNIIRTKMCTAIPLTVPIEVDINVGDNWLEAH